MPIGPYKIVLPGRVPATPLVAHIPHASGRVPPYVREQIVLSDEELKREIVRMTDCHVDHLFSWVLGLGGTMFVNELSRLVFDPERFADDAEEPMVAVGQGVVYTRTSQGEVVAEITAEERALRMRELYEPYHEGLTALVSARLREFGRCTILDCHSFASVPLPSDPNQTPDRPDICIGTDDFHTPPGFADALENAFAREGLAVARNRPFAGTLVPMEHFGRDQRVASVMIEVRRGLYCDEETGMRLPEFEDVREMLRRVVGEAVW